MNDRIREKLLGKRDLDLDKAVEVIKASQVTHSRALEIPGEASAQEDVNAVKHKPKPQRKSEKGKLPKSSTRNPSSNRKLKNISSAVANMHLTESYVQHPDKHARNVAKLDTSRSNVAVSL